MLKGKKLKAQEATQKFSFSFRNLELKVEEK